MFGLGLPEIAIILVVALLILGPKRLPDAARSLGRSLAEFRRASSELRSSLVLETTDPPESPKKSSAQTPSPAESRERDDSSAPGASADRPSPRGDGETPRE